MITPKFQAGDYVWIRDRHGKPKRRRIWRVSYVWEQVSPRDAAMTLTIETLFYAVSAKSPWAAVDLEEDALFATREEAEAQ